MPSRRDRNKDMYERLIAGGNTEEEVEAVYRKLRAAGYGEEETRRRLPEAVAALQAGPRPVWRLPAPVETPPRSDAPRTGSRGSRRACDDE